LGHTIIGAVWFVVAWWIQPALALWLSPILAGLMLSMPVSLLTGKTDLGRRLRDARWFIVPEETQPPPVLARVDQLVEERSATTLALPPDRERDHGLLQTVLDPYVNAVHLSLL